MPVSTHYFADRVINLAVTGPLIRIDFGAMQLAEGEGQKAQLIACQTLVMPLDGFIASVGMMETVIKKLIDDGVITKRPPGDAALAAPGAATASAPAAAAMNA